MQPRFAHNCTIPGCCRFVGQTMSTDVYVCRGIGDNDEPGLIMRYSSDGAGYSSWPALRYARLSAATNPEVFHAVQLVETHA